MEKFSFYEILSFLLPGFVLVGIVQLYLKFVFSCKVLFDTDVKFGESVILICLSLFSGILIHVFTFWLIKRKTVPWFNNIIMPSVQKISANDEFIQKTIPFLNEEYRRLKKHHEEPVRENEADNNLFDFAYYYLEVNDKISPAKNFQSLYFWLRNMFTISFFLLPVSAIIWLITLIGNYSCLQQCTTVWIMGTNLTLFFILIPTTRWLRKKYIAKVLWSYYVERIHHNEK